MERFGDGTLQSIAGIKAPLRRFTSQMGIYTFLGFKELREELDKFTSANLSGNSKAKID